jgi:hypothetical protein
VPAFEERGPPVGFVTATDGKASMRALPVCLTRRYAVVPHGMPVREGRTS